MSDNNKLQESAEPSTAELAGNIIPFPSPSSGDLTNELIANAFEDLITSMSEEEFSKFVMDMLSNVETDSSTSSMEPMRIAASKIFKKLIKY